MNWNVLFAVDHDSPYYNVPDKMALFYAQSWALVHMLELSPAYSAGRATEHGHHTQVNQSIVLKKRESCAGHSQPRLFSPASSSTPPHLSVREHFDESRCDWEEHTRDEFVTCDVEATLATMVEDAYVNHIPVLTGGCGKTELRRFYSEDFIPRMPPDTKLTPISRTIGEDQLVDEMILSFTHTEEMPWMLPGVAPTHSKGEIPWSRLSVSRREVGS